MGRIIYPKRPDRSRLQAARVAATRVGTASAQAVIAEELATIESGIPVDLEATIADLNQRLSELENLP